MSILKNIPDTNYYVIASEHIHVYPCAWRDSEYDKYSKLNTEYNLTGIPGTGLKDSYILEGSSDTLIKISVGGYRFEIDGADDADLDIIKAGTFYINADKPEPETATYTKYDAVLYNIVTKAVPTAQASLDTTVTTADTTKYFCGLGLAADGATLPTNTANLAMSGGKILFSYDKVGIDTDEKSIKDVVTLKENAITSSAKVTLSNSENEISGSFTGDLSGTAVTATTASKLSTNAGAVNIPVYFSGGVPVVTATTSNIGEEQYANMVVVTGSDGKINGAVSGEVEKATNVTTYIQSRAITIKTLTLTPTTGKDETYNLVCVSDDEQ